MARVEAGGSGGCRRNTGGEFDKSDRAELQSKVKDGEETAKDEVWGDYRFAVIADGQEADGLKAIDLGAGHSSSGETLCGRVIGALKSEALLNESAGAGYIERNWPPALKEAGAWPLASLRQSFLNGSLTRLVDPDAILKGKIVEFVGRGDFGLASGRKQDGSYERVWFQELLASDEVAFEAGVFLLLKATAETLKSGMPAAPAPVPEPRLGATTTATPPSPSPTPWIATPTTGRAGSSPSSPSMSGCARNPGRRRLASSPIWSTGRTGRRGGTRCRHPQQPTDHRWTCPRRCHRVISPARPSP